MLGVSRPIALIERFFVSQRAASDVFAGRVLDWHAFRLSSILRSQNNYLKSVLSLEIRYDHSAKPRDDNLSSRHLFCSSGAGVRATTGRPARDQVLAPAHFRN